MKTNLEMESEEVGGRGRLHVELGHDTSGRGHLVFKSKISNAAQVARVRFPPSAKAMNINYYIFPLSLSTRFPPVKLLGLSFPLLDWGFITWWAQLLITSLAGTYPAHRKIEVQ